MWKLLSLLAIVASFLIIVTSATVNEDERITIINTKAAAASGAAADSDGENGTASAAAGASASASSQTIIKTHHHKKCAANEKYIKCPERLCQPQTCDQVGIPQCSSKEEMYDTSNKEPCDGPAACVCVNNYVRNEEGVCMPAKNCPSCGNDKNATYGCGMNCGRRCSNYKKSSVECPDKCYVNSCDCKEDYVLDDITGKCVKPEDCSNKNPSQPEGSEGEPDGDKNENKENKDPCKKCDGKDCDVQDVNDSKQDGGERTCGGKKEEGGKESTEENMSCRGDINAKPGCDEECLKRCPGERPQKCKCIENSCECKDGFVYNPATYKCVAPSECSEKEMTTETSEKESTTHKRKKHRKHKKTTTGSNEDSDSTTKEMEMTSEEPEEEMTTETSEMESTTRKRKKHRKHKKTTTDSNEDSTTKEMEMTSEEPEEEMTTETSEKESTTHKRKKHRKHKKTTTDSNEDSDSTTKEMEITSEEPEEEMTTETSEMESTTRKRKKHRKHKKTTTDSNEDSTTKEMEMTSEEPEEEMTTETSEMESTTRKRKKHRKHKKTTTDSNEDSTTKEMEMTSEEPEEEMTTETSEMESTTRKRKKHRKHKKTTTDSNEDSDLTTKEMEMTSEEPEEEMTTETSEMESTTRKRKKHRKHKKTTTESGEDPDSTTEKESESLITTEKPSTTKGQKNCKGRHERFYSCAPSCPQRSCADYLNGNKCHREPAKKCKSECRCQSGHYKNSKGKCVSAQECRRLARSTTASMTSSTTEKSKGESSTTPEPNCEDSAYDSYVKGNLAFTAKLLNGLSQSYPGNNVMCGGSSVLYMLAELASYSKSKVTKEILNVLNFNDTEEIPCFFPKLFANLTVNQPDIEFNVFCKIYADKDCELTEDFKQTTKEIFTIGPDNIDYSDSESATIISDTVAENTNYQIENYIKPYTLSSLSSLILIDAQSFEGRWEIPFDPKDTTERDFYSNGRIYKKATMYTRGSFLYTESWHLHAQVVKMEFKRGGYTLAIFLPHHKDGYKDLIKKLEDPNIVAPTLDSLRYKNVELYIPKFYIAVANKLKIPTEMANVREIFNNKTTQLEDIALCDKPYVSEILQKLYLRVDEFGMGDKKDLDFPSSEENPHPPKRSYTFDANHSFVYYMFHQKILLFAGAYVR